MPSKKKTAPKIAKVHLKDLKPKKNPKGGLLMPAASNACNAMSVNIITCKGGAGTHPFLTI
jgi:hypothetical protein